MTGLALVCLTGASDGYTVRTGVTSFILSKYSSSIWWLFTSLISLTETSSSLTSIVFYGVLMSLTSSYWWVAFSWTIDWSSYNLDSYSFYISKWRASLSNLLWRFLLTILSFNPVLIYCYPLAGLIVELNEGDIFGLLLLECLTYYEILLFNNEGDLAFPLSCFYYSECIWSYSYGDHI